MTIPPSGILILQLIIHDKLFLYQSNNHTNQATTASGPTLLKKIKCERGKVALKVHFSLLQYINKKTITTKSETVKKHKC